MKSKWEKSVEEKKSYEDYCPGRLGKIFKKICKKSLSPRKKSLHEVAIFERRISRRTKKEILTFFFWKKVLTQLGVGGKVFC